MKKRIATVLAALLLVLGSASTALAGTHHNGTGCGTAEHYRLCTVKSCTRTRLHSHAGTTYRAHSPNDGHSYHRNHH